MRLSASCTSRVRLEVTTTIGGCAAFTVPSSGTVTWKSASTSSRNASKASSVRSISSINRTGAARWIGLERLQQWPLDQKAFGKHVVLDARHDRPRLRLLPAEWRSSGRRNSTRRPRRKRPGPRSTAAGSAGARASGEDLGDFGLADPRLALDKQRPAHLEREIEHRRQRAVGDVIGFGQQVEG